LFDTTIKHHLLHLEETDCFSDLSDTQGIVRVLSKEHALR
jgi:hypothetical protein